MKSSLLINTLTVAFFCASSSHFKVNGVVLTGKIPCNSIDTTTKDGSNWMHLFSGVPTMPSTNAVTRSMIGQYNVNNKLVEFEASYGMTTTASKNGTADQVRFMTQSVKKVNKKNVLGNQQFRFEYILNAPLGSKNFWLESDDHSCTNQGNDNVPFTYADVIGINLYHRI